MLSKFQSPETESLYMAADFNQMDVDLQSEVKVNTIKFWVKLRNLRLYLKNHMENDFNISGFINHLEERDILKKNENTFKSSHI